MLGLIVDDGARLACWRAFGRPQVVGLPGFAGNSSVSHKASRLTELVQAVTFKLVTNGTPGNRLGRVGFYAEDTLPFAEVVAPFVVTASLTSRLTFAVDVNQGGAAGAASIIGELPPLILNPGYTIKLDVIGGLAGDTVSEAKLTVQQLLLVDIHAGPDVRPAAEVAGVY